jgi:Protein of unknown function (DUF1761)
MPFNFIAVFSSALVTLIIGMIWYNPKVFGTIWMREAGLTEEELKKGSMIKIFGLTLFYSILFATTMPMITIHQMGALGMVGGPTLAETAKPTYVAFLADYGDAYRTFRHGALHGTMTGLFFALPIIAINGLFERKSWKYIAIHAGYWIIVMMIMGAIVCGWK